jgi:hypothetical protein
VPERLPQAPVRCLRSDKERLDSEAAALLENGTCILESWVSFRMELSVIVTRSVHGEISTFPAAENIHKVSVFRDEHFHRKGPDKFQFLRELNGKRLCPLLNRFLRSRGYDALEQTF